MAQITIQLPELKDLKTTLFSVGTAALYAIFTYYTTGGISKKEAAVCVAWAIKGVLCADSGGNQQDLTDLVNQVVSQNISKAVENVNA